MPFERLITMWVAVNQAFRGRWLRCMTVPAVTDVYLPQAHIPNSLRDASTPNPCHGHSQGKRSRRATVWPRDVWLFVGEARLGDGAGHRAVVSPAARHGENIA